MKYLILALTAFAVGVLVVMVRQLKRCSEPDGLDLARRLHAANKSLARTAEGLERLSKPSTETGR